MKSASELLEAYLSNVSTPKVSAAQFADDGVLELPWVQARAQGPAEVETLLTGMLAKVPDFVRRCAARAERQDQIAPRGSRHGCGRESLLQGLSFEVDGEQYIAVTAGWGLDAHGVQNGIDKIRATKTVVPKAGTLLVFKIR